MQKMLLTASLLFASSTSYAQLNVVTMALSTPSQRAVTMTGNAAQYDKISATPAQRKKLEAVSVRYVNLAVRALEDFKRKYPKPTLEQRRERTMNLRALNKKYTDEWNSFLTEKQRKILLVPAGAGGASKM